jgi:CheY-like chemotaxis protein/HPt (histidine-containing phosphotransfer) domain-containing protein
VPQHVIGDAGRLRQVLLNLAGNALKFTEQGSVALDVALSDDSATAEAGLVITVRDTGVGIAPEAVAKLFTRFSQGSAAIARHYGGSGLGLAISRELVELMGGEICVASELGQGSVFRFTMRLRRATDAPAPALPQTVESAPTAGRVIRVLLAEDDRVNQLVALDMLRKMGCSVDVVGDGRAAVEAAATKDYDIALLDALMPEIDGLQATRMIRSLPRPYSEIPIIAMTGRASVEDRAVCLAAGADEFIAKPASPEQLAAAFATLLGAGQQGMDEAMVPADFGEAAPVLIAIFTAETEARFRRMRGLCRAEDRSVLQREAHSLKSVAATFGCRRLAEMAAALESDATSDRFDVARAVDDMALEFERMRKRINREIADRREAA